MTEVDNADHGQLVLTSGMRMPMEPVDYRAPTSAAAYRILLVCESVLFQHVVTRLLAADTRFEIVGIVRGASAVLPFLDRVRLQAVLFDGELPEMELKATLRRMRKRHARVGGVLCHPLEERCSLALVGSTAAGGSLQKEEDAVEAFRSDCRDFATAVRARLLEACGSGARGAAEDIGLPANGKVSREEPGIGASPTGQSVRVATAPRKGPQVLAIGCSTGGPAALTSLLSRLPPDFPLPVLIVQHMPPHFTPLLAERLMRASRIPVMEAEDGMEVNPGVALLAPGDVHMRLVRRSGTVEVRLTQDERENSCRPAVDALFRSVADIYRGGVIATVLTGMGQDGLKGARVLKEGGAFVFVQDRETSVVWGMPGAIAGAGLADAVLPLDGILPAILGLL